MSAGARPARFDKGPDSALRIILGLLRLAALLHAIGDALRAIDDNLADLDPEET